MVRKSYMPEQIINKLREAEILLSQGATLAVIKHLKTIDKISFGVII